MAKSKDLFDDTTMTFGEHLEALRGHLIKAVLGLALVLVATLSWGNHLVDLIRTPIDQALHRSGLAEFANDDIKPVSFWTQVRSWFGGGSEETTVTPEPTVAPDQRTVIVHIKRSDLARVLHEVDPKIVVPAASEGEKADLSLPMSATEFRDFRQSAERWDHPVALNVQEAFMMYLKVAFIGGLIIAGPWIFYQLWQFVAAGLYPHERRYVHVYMPLSIALFMLGVVFCFYLALPLVLDFLLSYNRWLHVNPQIRLSEWVGFVIVLPLMFGLSFQLPLVMLFLERLGIFKADDYRTKRRLAIFAIAVLAMVLSPGGDPGTMMVMFIPLVVLYEFGIVLCGFWKTKRPFEEPAIS